MDASEKKKSKAEIDTARTEENKTPPKKQKNITPLSLSRAFTEFSLVSTSLGNYLQV